MKKTGFILTICVFALSLIPLLWFRGNEILLGYDNVYPLSGVSFIRDRLFSWTNTGGLGLEQSGIQGSLIIHTLDTLPQVLGFSVQTSQKIVFVFWFFLLLASPWLFIKKIEKLGFVRSSLLRYIFPVLYAINFYLLQAWWIAERTKFSLVVALPLIFSQLLTVFAKPLPFLSGVRIGVICALILSFFNGGGWEGISLYGGLFVLLACLYAFAIFYSFIQKDTRYVKSLSLIYASFSMSFVFLNAYTLVPFIVQTVRSYKTMVDAAGGTSGLVEWAWYLSINTGFLNLLRLQGIPDWYNNAGHPYAPFYLQRVRFILASFFFPFAIFLSLRNKDRSQRLIVSLSLFLLIVSLFFTAGIHKPLGFVFEFLMRSVPGFIAFRSPIFKFGYLYWFVATFFVSLCISEVALRVEQRIQNRFHDILHIGIILFVIIGTLWYHFPYIGGDFFRIDSGAITSRVSIPSYVYDFYRWWKPIGTEEKILLIPRLNDNWVFEQYRWGYLSLFPLLKDLATPGVVENTDLLSRTESDLVNSLYQAINDEDFDRVESLASMLGIRYFLIRKDFFFDLANQETDDPVAVEQHLVRHGGMSFVQSFGEWTVYRLQEPKPLISIATSAITTEGLGIENLYREQNPAYIDSSNLDEERINKTRALVRPNCLSCKAERREVNTSFPKPKILLDSNLYEFTQLRDRLRRQTEESVDAQVFQRVGDSLKYMGQINELILHEKSEDIIRKAGDLLIAQLDAVAQFIPTIIELSPNPYETITVIRQYVDAENKYLNDLITRNSSKDILIVLQKVTFAIDRLIVVLENFYSKWDINSKKYYKFSIPADGAYRILVRGDSLGFIDETKKEEVSIELDGSRLKPDSVEGKNLSFGKQELLTGPHTLIVIVPPQNNLLTIPIQQNVLGKLCYSSFIKDFSLEHAYNLEFQSRNNFHLNFSMFIDDGRSFSPSFTLFFPVSAIVYTNQRFVISRATMSLPLNMKEFRIAFCAPNLTLDGYLDNIKNLSVTLLTIPEVTLARQIDSVKEDPPAIEVKRINQTHYRVRVLDAKNPFYLVFSQRYSSGWEATIGDHMPVNHFANAWYIDKTGTYDVDIVYTPQRLIVFGAVISGISLAIAVVWLFAKRGDS